ncbi:MAG TPA: endo-1,4-beta-xylanase [Tepidisphaeraceae bacterium]|nr:endo-1,4-beta-xylanase [Tepidisphaeraceae bacterium]
MNRRTFLALVALLFTSATLPAATKRWTLQEAQDWQKNQPWLVGSNFIPSTAVNELEMWQPETFDLPTIDRELGWAEGLGFNTVRVFLHNLLWKHDADGFLRRMDQFLSVADKHHIKVMFVLFDACWDPYPRLGKQHEPRPGLHNSGWVQAPGRDYLQDRARWGELESYVSGVVRHFKNDSRIVAWDVFNEPDNTNNNSYGKEEPPNKPGLALELLRQEFQWCRYADPSQPLTTAPWKGTWPDPRMLSPMEREQLGESDVISFHCYAKPGEMRQAIENLSRYDRPLLCTEYMARPKGSTFAAILPLLKERNVAAYNWGFVAGKTNTIYPWDSWQHPYASEPPLWFHDIFRADGTPYDQNEIALIRTTTGKAP